MTTGLNADYELGWPVRVSSTTPLDHYDLDSTPYETLETISGEVAHIDDNMRSSMTAW